MNVYHIDFKEKRELTETEIEDKIADQNQILQDPVVRLSRALERIRKLRQGGGF